MSHHSRPAERTRPRHGGSLLLACRLVTLLAAAVVAGGTFAIWRGFAPHGLSAGAYVEMQQGSIRGLNALFPLTGLLAVVATAALAVRAKGPAPRSGSWAKAFARPWTCGRAPAS